MSTEINRGAANRPAKTPRTTSNAINQPTTSTPSKLPAPKPAAEGKRKLPILTVVLLVLFAGALGVPVWLAYQSKSELDAAQKKIQQLELAKSAERKELDATLKKLEAAQKEAEDNDALFDFIAEAIILDPEEKPDSSKMLLSMALDRATSRLNAGEFKDRKELELQLRRTVGIAYLRIGRYDDAEAHLRLAYDMTKELAGGDDKPEMLEAINGLALVLAAKGDVSGATPLLTRGMEMYTRFIQEQPVGRVGHLAGMIQGALAEEKYLEAAGHASYSVAVLERQFGRAHPLPILARMQVAQFLGMAGEVSLAEMTFRDIVNRLERILPGVHPHLADSFAGLAGALIKNGKPKEAETYARRCLKIREAVLPKDHWQRYSAMCIVGEALAGQEKHEAAEKMLQRAYKGLTAKKSEAPDRRKRDVCEALASLYRNLGQEENVEKYEKLASKYKEKRSRKSEAPSAPAVDRG